MSAELDVGDALAAWAPLVALLGSAARICRDEAPGSMAHPYLVFARQGGRIERGLDGSVHGRVDVFEVQCIGTSRDHAARLREAVVEALQAAGQPPEETQAIYDEQRNVEAEVVTVEWWAD